MTEERSSLLSLLAPFSTTERLRKFFTTVVLRPMSSDPAALVVFARLPIPGKAKTRLAKDVGDANAAEFYARMAERIFTVTSRCERISSRTVFFSERGEEDGIRRWLQGKRRERALDPRAASWADIRLEPQAGGGDLGERMRRALDHALSRGGSDGGPCAKAIVIGTDIPSLDAKHVDRAVTLLDTHDAVFGPAVDGGYYLLGVRASTTKNRTDGGAGPGAVSGGAGSGGGGAGPGAAHPAMFTDIPWSTGTVLVDSLRACDANGVAYAPVESMETLRDVDTADDVYAWIECRFDRSADTGVYVPNELADAGWDLLRDSGHGCTEPHRDDTRLPD